VPSICDFSLTRKAYSIADSESFATARALLKEEGILAGSSTGTLLSAALRYCRDQSVPKRVVTFACDTGSRYLSKLYNEFWMEDQGFIRREHFGDLRDLIGRPHDERATITVGPNDVVTTAHNRLRNSGISQLPVLDNGKLMGVLTEEDIMRFAFGHPDRLDAPVREAMQTAFISVPKEMPVKSLVSILQVAPYAVVLDGEQFLGLITRSDVLNHLRREVQS
jgi:cystathionine beta-synthase